MDRLLNFLKDLDHCFQTIELFKFVLECASSFTGNFKKSVSFKSEYPET